MSYPIKIINQKITPDELKSFLNKPFEEMVKFVVDIEKKLLP